MSDSVSQDVLTINMEINGDSIGVLQKMSTDDIIILIDTVTTNKKYFVNYLLTETNIFTRDDYYKILKILDSELRIEVISHIAIRPHLKYSIRCIYEILSQYDDHDEKKYIFNIFQGNIKYFKKIDWIPKMLSLFSKTPKEDTLQIIIFLFGKYKGKIDRKFIDHVCLLLNDNYYRDNIIHIVRAFKYVDTDGVDDTEDDINCVEEIRTLISGKITDINILHQIYCCLNINKKVTFVYNEFKYDLSQIRMNDKLSFFKDNKKIIEIYKKSIDTYLLIIYDGDQIIEEYFSQNIIINDNSKK